jgi:hypothetical protein
MMPGTVNDEPGPATTTARRLSVPVTDPKWDESSARHNTVSPESLTNNNLEASYSIAQGVQITAAVDSMRLETGNLSGLQSGSVCPYVDEQFDLESISVNPKIVQFIRP